jgi:hypothetical protein
MYRRTDQLLQAVMRNVSWKLAVRVADCMCGGRTGTTCQSREARSARELQTVYRPSHQESSFTLYQLL